MKIQGSDTSSIQNFCTKSSNFISQQKHWCWKCHLFPVATILAKQFWDTFPFSRVFVWNLQLTSHSHSQTQLKQDFSFTPPPKNKVEVRLFDRDCSSHHKMYIFRRFLLTHPSQDPQFSCFGATKLHFQPLDFLQNGSWNNSRIQKNLIRNPSGN